MMNLYWTKNIQLYNFLWEQGFTPIVEYLDGSAAYYRTAELVSALESYQIRKSFGR